MLTSKNSTNKPINPINTQDQIPPQDQIPQQDTGDWIKLPAYDTNSDNSDFEEEEEEEEEPGLALINACRTQWYDIDAIELLLKAGCNPDHQDEFGDTALHVVLRTIGELTPTRLQAQDYINKFPEKLRATKKHALQRATESFEALTKAKLELVTLLLKNKANPNIKDTQGNVALHYAAKRHNVEVAKLLIKSKADVNIQNNKGIFPYQYVKTYCDKTLVHLLEPEQKSLGRQLLQAVHERNHEKVKQLLEQNADPNIRDTLGRGPLTWAIMNNDLDMVELLIQNKANVNIGGLYQPLYMAAMHGYAAIVDILIKHNANIAHLNYNGLTASEEALRNKHYNIAFILQQKLYQQNTTLVPFLHQAVKKLDTEMVATLVKRGVDVNAQSENGDTALTIAEKIKNTEIIDLLNKPSIVKQKNQDVINRLLQVAAMQDMVSLLQELINMGGDINNPYIDDGNTALHYAAMHNNINAVNLLMQNKADITIKNKEGETALEIGQLVAQNIELNIKQNSNNHDTNFKALIAHQENNAKIIKLIQSHPQTPIQATPAPKAKHSVNLLEAGLFESTPAESGEPNEEQISDDPTEDSGLMTGKNPIDLWGGACFDSLSECAEEESESETQEIAISPAKKALNKHIITIRNKGTIDNNKLDALQQRIAEKREIEHKQIIDLNVDEVKLTSNSESIKNSIKQLAQNNEDPRVLNNLLIIATMQSDSDTMKSLLEKEHVDPNFVDDNGCSALHYATIQDDVEKVELLLNNRANVNITDNHGNTPLHAAVILKRTDVIKSLLEKEADVNAQDHYGNTASHFAAEAGYQQAIDLLHDKNADFTIKDLNGFTALDHAIKSTIDLIPQVTPAESSAKDSSNNSSSADSPQYCDPKFLNLMHTIQNLVGKEEVKQQDNAKFLLDTQFPTLLKSLEDSSAEDQNSVNHNILESLDDVFGRWHEPGSTAIVEDLMAPVYV